MKDLDSDVKYVKPQVRREIKSGARFCNGDTLFARISPCLENGKICQVKTLNPNEVGFGSTEFLVFRGKKNVTNSDFIYYLLKSEYIRNCAIQMMTGSSGRQRVERKSIENLLVRIPDLAEQSEIAATLSAFDEKIDTNLEINKTIEAINESIFVEWFINYNYPNSRHSNKINIPDGWETVPLKEVGEIVNGFAFKSGDYKSEGIRMIRSLNITTAGTINNKSSVFLDNSQIKDHPSQYLEAYDYLMVMVGSSLGKQGIVRPYNLPALLNQNMWNFRLKNNHITRHYFNYYLKFNLNKYFNYASGSAISFVKKSDYYELPILIPDKATLQSFEKLASINESKISANLEQNEILTSIRDSCISRLIDVQLNR